MKLPQDFFMPGEKLNKVAFYGEPAQLCDAEITKIKGLAPLILPQKFPHLLFSASIALSALDQSAFSGIFT